MDSETPPVFRWDPWPEGMFTAKQLREKGLVPGPVAGLIPYSKSKDGDGYLRVYKLDEATLKPPLSEARQNAIAKMKAAKLAKRTCQYCKRVTSDLRYLYRENLCCRCAAQLWAKSMLEADVVILDTETTGVKSYAEIIAISVIDPHGAVLFDTYVKPQRPIVEVAEEDYDEDNWRHREYGPGPTAFGINGISNAMVADAPSWPQVVERLRPLLLGKTVVCYNEEFDHWMLDDDCEFHRLPKLEAAGWECLMLNFAMWYGEWNGRYRDYAWQSLWTAGEVLEIEAGDAHTAAGDCFTSLGVLKALAAKAEATEESP